MTTVTKTKPEPAAPERERGYLPDAITPQPARPRPVPRCKRSGT